ncbi:MAG TPA: cupin domain-containing protein [Balneolales bacterium]|nr:cupin domain-containing protein [Balneolales bacterium]
MKNNSKVIHCKNYHWNSVEKKQYKTDSSNFKDISRYSLLGEGKNEHELNIQTRYFEIQPGGYSSLEYHRHPHSVIIIRGSGSVILGDEVHPLGLHDVIYISPETIHQFHADNNEPLGFICVVDRYRDRPTIPDKKMLEEKVTNTTTRDKIKI